jgi:hypothetical protein
VEEINLVNVKDVMPRLASADFRTTVKYTGPLEHQYIMSHWRGDYLNLWLDMRELIATQGIVRTYQRSKFFKSKRILKFIDLPDGFTYWVSSQWITDNWDEAFDPDGDYFLSREVTRRHLLLMKDHE